MRLSLLIFVFFLPCGICLGAELALEYDNNADPRIYISGEIRPGDAAKLDELMRGAKVADLGTLVLNSPGGDYLEGLKIGMAAFNNGWATLVQEDAVCYSACAIAFLGGRFFGASRGWAPARKLEYGGKLGFHSFYGASSQLESLASGMEAGKLLANLLHAYAAELQISPRFINYIMTVGRNELILVNFPALLKELKIDLLKMPARQNSLSLERAIGACEELLAGRDPEDWEFAPLAGRLTPGEFKKDILRRIEAAEDHAGCSAVLRKHIAAALKDDDTKAINELYEELAWLGVCPYVGEGEREIIRITGLNNVHHYLSRTAYLLVANSGTDNIAVNWLLLGPADLPWTVESGDFFRRGDAIYELYEPYEKLWPSGRGFQQ